MHPILLKIGNISFPSFGLMAALGFLAGTLTSILLAKKEKISSDSMLDLSFYVILSSLIGARFFYVIGQWDYYSRNGVEILMVQNGGLVFLGGMIFALLSIYAYSSIKKIVFFDLLDAIAPGVALGYSIGRIGCFLNGCCFGLPTKLPWGIVFPKGSLAAAYIFGEHIHPTQVYASLSMLAAFFFLLFLYRKKSYSGQIFLWGVFLYSIYRFLVEFMRFSPIHWGGLTPSQWLCLVIFIFCWGGFAYFRNKSGS